MRRFEGLADIVENRFCTSCGLCTLCAPEGVVQMGWAANGQLRPRAARPPRAWREPSQRERQPRTSPGWARRWQGWC